MEKVLSPWISRVIFNFILAHMLMLYTFRSPLVPCLMDYWMVALVALIHSLVYFRDNLSFNGPFLQANICRRNVLVLHMPHSAVSFRCHHGFLMQLRICERKWTNTTMGVCQILDGSQVRTNSAMGFGRIPHGTQHRSSQPKKAMYNHKKNP